ncbi:hypothetical protein P691DRAFT_794044 [Macrolepiota fuliginosa MF-IS2]|uniref:Tyr recombinase domain-containing protein n=1 Tax=Macrolepiota fuliginosa MF-IS2 TaxID=1400762 RepID=A0A9P5WWD3_9AGAR|nr:hypothetical protein P691DRAFT_794044 [Macrolepiota fuliginosa MF-IS2]
MYQPTRMPAQSLTPSPLRPLVLAKDRLLHWKATNSRPSRSLEDNNELKELMVLAWDDEEDWAPASHDLLSDFVKSLAGVYSGSTVNNYLAGVRAWHQEMDVLAPPSAKRPKREPYTIDYILAIRAFLNLSSPLHAAFYACLTTAFYATARLGEVTIPNLNAFNPTKHVKLSNMRTEKDRNGLITTVTGEGEDIYWLPQEGPTDPQAALDNHFHVNAPPPHHHLFAYKHKGKHRPLTKGEFKKIVGSTSRAAGLIPRPGHAIRSGSTLEYLLRGVPFEAMKAKGRWASDAFSLYLTKHAQILAPYMQQNPGLHNDFLQLTIPPRRR